MFFIAWLEAWERALHDERSKLFAIDLRKHNVNIGEAAVGDPHLLSVENVMRSFRIQFRAGQRVLRVRPRLGLGKAVRADPLAGGQLRQILFLLRFCAEVHDRQCPNSRMRTVRHREPAVNRKFFRQHCRGNFVQPRAAILLGNTTTHQTDFATFFHQLGHQPGLFVFEFFDERKNFLEDKFLSRLPDQLLIVRQIRGREDVARLRRFQEKAASLCCRLGEGSRGHLGRS